MKSVSMIHVLYVKFRQFVAQPRHSDAKTVDQRGFQIEIRIFDGEQANQSNKL